MQSVMVVDDEALVLLDLVMTIEELGYDVHSDSTSLGQAIEHLENDSPDIALLDIDVGGELVWPLARLLTERSKPVVFLSANLTHRELDEEFGQCQRLEKPASRREIREALASGLGES